MRLVARAGYLALLLWLAACDDPTAPPIPDVVERRLQAATYAPCVLDSAGEVYCWGANILGSIPGSGTAWHLRPMKAEVPPLREFALGAADHHCGITPDGAGYCWGRNLFGQTGSGTMDLITPPMRVGGSLIFRQMVMGQITTCGITDAGDGYCWGMNQRGELGDATATLDGRYPSPRLISGGHKWKSLAAGWIHTCGIRTDGVAMCWGSNQYGTLGIGEADAVMHREPREVAGGLRFAQIAADLRQTCALTYEGKAYCWGLNAFGQIGDGTTFQRAAPTAVHGNLRFRLIIMGNGSSRESSAPGEVQAARSHVCGVTTSGRAYCWGSNGHGQIGNGNTTSSPVPLAVDGGLTFDVLSVVGSRTCGMRGNDVWCWGNNEEGQLGDGGESPALTPRAVPLPPPA